MPKVKNKKIIATLSHKSLAANRVRNAVAVLAIALTATLFTALFTIGGSMAATMENATMRQVGTKAHAGFKYLTQQQYDTVAADPAVRDISYNIMLGIAENPELAKNYTEIRYTEPKSAAWSFCTPTTGTLPQKKYDLACATAVLDALGVPHELGQTVHLEFTARGKQWAQDFTLCGYWEGDIALGASEAFVSREYCEAVAPTITVPVYETASNDFSGTISPSFWFSNAWDIDAQADALVQRCGFDSRTSVGVNWAYTTATMDAGGILLLAGALSLILFSGYLIIYNVFLISVSRDVRFYGLLKTIGTTPRQLRSLVRRQALLLSIVGIPLGLLAGYGVGCLVMPAVIQTTNIAANFVLTANPLVFIGAAVFALVTVLISCIRPCRMAARVSPIEALQWTGQEKTLNGKAHKARTVSPLSMAWASLCRDRKKAVLVVASLTLSLVLLNGTYTIITGFDLEKYVQNASVCDFSLTDASLRGAHGQTETLNGVSETAMQQVKALPGIEKAGAIWCSLGTHTLSESAAANARTILTKDAEELPSPYADQNIQMIRQDSAIYAFYYGVDESLWDKLELAGGTALDREKFASGDYVIASAFWDDGEDPYYRPGDSVTIDFGNGKKKTYTVLAIGSIPYALSPQFGFALDLSLTLPAEEYARQMGDSQPMSMGFDVDDEHVAAAEQWCEQYTEAKEQNLTYTSRDTIMAQFQSTKRMFVVVGGALSLLLGLIGVLNFANAIITSISARRREIAMLQSVGMTGHQVRTMLCDEGLIYIGFTLLLAATVGNVLCWAGIRAFTADLWFFTYHLTLVPIALCAPLLLLLAVFIPAISCKQALRQSVVERLREAE